MNNKSNTIRVNIDDFQSIASFELFFFRVLKKAYPTQENGFIIYTLKRDIHIFSYIIDILIPKLWRIEQFISRNNIKIKFLNIPYCITRNEDIIKKYFINEVFLNKIYVLPKSHNKCYKCKYYFSCPWYNSHFVQNFNCLTIQKNQFLNKIDMILLFFENIWIPRKNIYFDFLFELNTDFEEMNTDLMHKIELFIDWLNWVSYENYFIDTENMVSWVRSNLFFRNYLLQNRFNRLLKKLGLSIFLSYTDFDRELYKDKSYNIEWDEIGITQYNGINYWFQRKKNISLHLMEELVFKKRTDIWMEIQWRSNINHYTNNCKIVLEIVTLSDINKVVSNFEKYLVLFFEHDLNLYIPEIYKFKYFLSYNRLEELAHYKIIFNEIGAQYIDHIWTGIFYWLETGQNIEANFFTWFIKRIW